MSDGFPLRVAISVQFRDLDAFGHVNNAVYFSYFETGRIAYVQAIMGRPLTLADLPIVVVDAACRYRSPALLGEQLELGVRVSHIRRSSFACEYALHAPDTGRLIAEGRSIQSMFDHRNGKVIALDPEIRARIERFEGHPFDPRATIPPWGR